jgi:hypothetical protein
MTEMLLKVVLNTITPNPWLEGSMDVNLLKSTQFILKKKFHVVSRDLKCLN